jgi:N-acetylglucosaminyl-diphospho-decaprenol L-rhamnosyltransferase
VTTAVVTLAHGRHDHLALQHCSLALATQPPDVYVVVAIADPWIESWQPEPGPRPHVVGVPTDPRGLPLAAARNAGFAAAYALGADVAIGLDVDCLAGPELVEAYTRAVAAEPGVVWSGPVTYLAPPGDGGYDVRTIGERDDPHPGRPGPPPGVLARDLPAELFWSLSFACHRRAWEAVGGFHEGYVGYGAEDTDFGRMLASEGIEHAMAGSARAYHQHHEVERPPVRHLPDLLRNGALYAARWGTWPMSGWFAELERLGHVSPDGAGWVATPQGLAAARAARGRTA